MATDERVLRTLRVQSWERAKGELHALLQTFWNDSSSSEGQFEKMGKAINEFVKHVEDNGLCE